jgi:hypothetical protein
MVPSADGRVEMKHGNWHLDRYDPAYVPPIGSRVFVDLTEELARPRAVEYVEKYWNHPTVAMSVHPTLGPLGRKGAVEHFVQSWISDWGGHSPWVIVITPALHEQFKARADALGRSRT